MADTLKRISELTKQGEKSLGAINREISENIKSAKSWVGKSIFMYLIAIIVSLLLNLNIPHALVILMSGFTTIITCLVFYNILTQLRRLRHRHSAGVELMRLLAKDCRSLSFGVEDPLELYTSLHTLVAYEDHKWNWLIIYGPILDLFSLFVFNLFFIVVGYIVLISMDEFTFR